MIDIGSLDRRISFIAYEDKENDIGLTEQTQVVKLKCWARIESLRGKEYYEAQKLSSETTHKITIRYRAGLDENMLISYKNRIFEIQSIIDPYESHVKLEIMCKEKKRGKVIQT